MNEMPNITGIFVSGAGLSGVAQAVYERGTADVQKIVGFDATQRNITYMKNGTVQFLIDQSPYKDAFINVTAPWTNHWSKRREEKENNEMH